MYVCGSTKELKEGQMLKIQKSKINLILPVVCCGALIAAGFAIVDTIAMSTYAAVPTLKTITTMQEMTSLVCASSEIGDTNTLTDARDGETYTVRKHEDGNCWMTQNLRLAGEKTLTPADSDVASDYTLPASDINGFDESNYYASQMYYAGDETNGAYYSWTAATAGTGDASLTKGDAPSSICPKGWKLPPNKGNGSYANFVEKVGITDDASGSTKIRSEPYNFANAGLVFYNTLAGVGADGHYWSRTIRSNNDKYAYNLWLASTNADTSGSDRRSYGFSVRCVAVSLGGSDESNVAIEVAPVLTIDATAGMEDVVEANEITTGNISATVTANTAYQVMLSAAQTALRDANIANEEIPASANVTPGTDAWGIATGNTDTPYAAITTSPTVYPATVTDGTEVAQKVHQFGIGVSVSSSLSSGTYSTIVTVTAAAP